MYALVLSLALLGQVEANSSSPNSTNEPPTATATTEELKAWLLSRLILELSFDEAKIADVERRLDKMSDRQLRILIELYRDRVAKRDAAEAARRRYMEQQVLNQAQLDLQRAQSYKEYLQREYQRQILQGHMEQNLVQQNIVNQQRFWNGGYGYGGWGYNSGGRPTTYYWGNTYPQVWTPWGLGGYRPGPVIYP